METDRETRLAMLERLRQLSLWEDEFESLVRRDRPVDNGRIELLQAKARLLMSRVRDLAVHPDFDLSEPVLREYLAGKEQYRGYGHELRGIVWDAAHAEDLAHTEADQVRRGREHGEKGGKFGFKGGRPSKKPTNHQLRLDYQRHLDAHGDAGRARAELVKELVGKGHKATTVRGWLRLAGI